MCLYIKSDIVFNPKSALLADDLESFYVVMNLYFGDLDS